MWLALCATLLGVLAGRLGRALLSRLRLPRLVYGAVLFLLFSLGVEIGGSDAVFDSLPALGWQAAALALAGMAGSVCVVAPLGKFLRPRE